MKIEIFGALTLREATKNTLASINYKDINILHYVVVPDRFSLQAEKLVFECLNISSTFNIRVVGISSFAVEILNRMGVNCENVSNLQTILLTNSAILNVKDKLKYYKKNSINFCNDVAKIISLLKSSSILPEDMNCNVKNQYLALKLEDIKLIYEEYEKLLGERVDANKLLLLFEEVLNSYDKPLKIQAHFVNFDSLTTEGFKILCAISKKAQKVTFAMAFSQGEGNSYIYENDILDKVKRIAIENSVVVDFRLNSENLSQRQLSIVKNLFSKNIQKFNDDAFKYFVATDINMEVEFFAKLIKNKVYRGEKYNSFQIACSNLEKYQRIIENIFEKYDIPYWTDLSKSLDDTLLAREILKILSCAKAGITKNDLCYFISSALQNFDKKEEILSFVEGYNIDTKDKFKQHFHELDFIFKFIENLEKCTKIADFCDKITEILMFFKENMEKLVVDCEKYNEIKFAEICDKSYEKLLSLCEELKKFDGEKEIEISDFESLLKLSLENMEIDFVPAYIDCVFVGDATSSFFEEKDNLIVLGATNVDLPKVISDNAILSDDDIDDIEFKNRIEPTVRMMNRRNKLKIFELLTMNFKTLSVSSYLHEGNVKFEKSGFVDDLLNMFGRDKEIRMQDFEILSPLDFDKDIGMSKFLFGLGTKKAALLYLSDSKKYKSINTKFINALAKYLNVDIENLKISRKFLDESVDKQKLYFKRNTFSASQIENYFACPFLHFLRYGLRLKEEFSVDIEKKDLGSLYHLFAELLLKEFGTNLKNLSDEDIMKFILNHFDECTKDLYLDFLDNRNAISQMMKKDAFEICKNIVYENKHSDYSPLEEEFKILSEDIAYDYNENKIKLYGKVDRVDVCDNSFRIVDYKTGKTGNVLKELYYGLKLQLFLYSSEVGKKINKNLDGVFYFDCDLSFDNVKESKKLLKGVYPKLNSIVEKLDNRLTNGLEKSDIIGVEIKKTPDENGFAYKYSNGVDVELKKLEDYAVAITKNAIEEIVFGYTEPKPAESKCRYCKMRGICLYDKKLGERKLDKEVKEEVFTDFDGRE